MRGWNTSAGTRRSGKNNQRKTGELPNRLAVDWCERKDYAVVDVQGAGAREAAKSAVAEPVDPWRLTLERVRGKIDFFDRLERVSSQTLLDLLEVPQRNRTAGTYRRLAKVMAELGWTAVRVRGPTRGGYLEQVRGYCRQPRTQAGH